MPDEIGYDASQRRLLVGSGFIENVPREVWEYEVSGKRVLINVLHVLAMLVDMEPAQAQTLEAICDGPTISYAQDAPADRPKSRRSNRPDGPGLFREEDFLPEPPKPTADDPE